MSKICSKCKITKPFSEFSTSNPTKKDGHNSWCKQCCRDSSKDYSKTIKGVYASVKGNQTYFHRHSSKQKKPFLITYKEFETWYEDEPKKCAYCYLPESELHNVNDTHNAKTSRLTVDCKTNELGYQIGNLVLACNRCNFTKNDFLNYEQMFFFSQTYIKPIWEERLGRKLE